MTTHLDYYREHNISPVTYSGTEQQHYERRASLYRALRLPPLAFRNAHVLEVAAGTGQNAHCLYKMGADIVCIEPNPINWKYALPLINKDFSSWYNEWCRIASFDIVICENWIGLDERPVIGQLASLVGTDGVLVLTCVHPLGIYPNLLRRKLADKLLSEYAATYPSATYEDKVALLVRAFKTHLDTLPDMTRSAEDWVKDMLLNPAVDRIGLTFPMLAEQLCARFSLLGTSPEFMTDWRWFKELHGYNRKFTERALLVYRLSETAFGQWDDSYPKNGWREAEALLRQETITGEDVRDMKHFARCFGRETIYTSWQRN